MVLFDPAALTTRTPFGTLVEVEQALEQNLTATFEGSRVLLKGLSALSGELGRFAEERLARHGALLGDLMAGFARGPDPAAAFGQWADYIAGEAEAWEAEQGRLIGLWSQTFTESLVTFEDLAEVPGP